MLRSGVIRPAIVGPIPPNGTSVNSRGSYPRSTVMVRIATLDGIQPSALKDLNEVMSKVLAGGDKLRKACDDKTARGWLSEKLTDANWLVKALDQRQRTILKGTRWLLLKNPENLDEGRNKIERLSQTSRLNEPLAIAYLKEDLRQVWSQPNKRTRGARPARLAVARPRLGG